MKRREFLLLLGAIMAGRPLHAQQKAMPVIGFLGSASPSHILAAFHQGLGETGYVDGQNLAFEYRWAEGRYDRLPALAADLVLRPVDLGLVASLARPGGNLTGVSTMAPELSPKRLELLSELVPQVGVIALLVNPNNSNTQHIIGEMQEAARAKGVQLHILIAGTESEIDAAFATLVQLHASALVVGGDPFFGKRREQLVTLAASYGVPAIYQSREFAAAGGLISYGASFPATFRLAGIYAGKILNGAKPADLPVQQPTTFELVVNLKTAKALGLTVPPSILARVDEVIE